MHIFLILLKETNFITQVSLREPADVKVMVIKMPLFQLRRPIPNVLARAPMQHPVRN